MMMSMPPTTAAQNLPYLFDILNKLGHLSLEELWEAPKSFSIPT
jgi:hypothetical protein